MREDNWPLLTVSKGFFEQLATKGGCAGSPQPPSPKPASLRLHAVCRRMCTQSQPASRHVCPRCRLSVCLPAAADSERAKGAPGAAAAAAAAAMEELDMGDVGAGWGEEDDLGAAAAAEGECACRCS